MSSIQNWSLLFPYELLIETGWNLKKKKNHCSWQPDKSSTMFCWCTESSTSTRTFDVVCGWDDRRVQEEPSAEGCSHFKSPKQTVRFSRTPIKPADLFSLSAGVYKEGWASLIRLITLFTLTDNSQRPEFNWLQRPRSMLFRFVFEIMVAQVSSQGIKTCR